VVTNHPSHDPDIEQLPFFAISPAFFENLWSSFHKRTMFFDHFAALDQRIATPLAEAHCGPPTNLQLHWP